MSEVILTTFSCNPLFTLLLLLFTYCLFASNLKEESIAAYLNFLLIVNGLRESIDSVNEENTFLLIMVVLFVNTVPLKTNVLILATGLVTTILVKE